LPAVAYPTAPRRRQPREQGAILLLVLWVLALLSIMILSWTQEWRTEIQLAANFRDAARCRSLAEAGIHYALAKLIAAKTAELQSRSVAESVPLSPDIWLGDQRRRLLELPGGKVEIQVADEGGKLDLNLVYGKVLASLFEAMGFPETRVRIMVDSIQDWRSKGDQPRPYGARDAYYLGLNPPYRSKSARFDTVEELSWVRGFTGSNLKALAAFLTTQSFGLKVNVNTAPKEVLLAIGFTPDQVMALLAARQTRYLRQLRDVPQVTVDPQAMQMMQNLVYTSSPFFTILATGMINNKGRARHTIKAIVRLDLTEKTDWTYLYWADDYPG
jgi:general secretion pathway protein K